MKGTIVRWFTYRGFGFIEPDDGEEDIFLHITELKNSVEHPEGQEVEFEVEPSWKGPRAVNVKVLN
jgi:CspA family cold shock protein